jgi:peptidoglycan/LPS O-acetylase OafA/YrhL
VDWWQFGASFFLLPFVHYPRWLVLVDYTWTLVFEMFFYFLLSAIQLATVRRAVAVLITLQCVLIGLGHLISIRQPVLIVACSAMQLEFIYGALIAMAFQAFGQQRRIGLALVTLGSVATILLLVLHVTSPTEQWIMEDHAVLFRVLTWGIAAACIVGGVVLWLPAIQNRLTKTLVVLGNASYSAYLASSFVIRILIRLTGMLLRESHLPLSPRVQAVLQAGIACGTLVAGWAIYQWLEFPLLRTLQGRFLSKPAT